MLRLKQTLRNWLGLRYDYPHRFIQLVPWRDTMLALDGDGNIYELQPTFYGREFVIQLHTKNPIAK